MEQACLVVESAGLSTWIVDGGRPKTRGLGVPVGGAADRFAQAWGNALLGNPADAAALEVCLTGPTLRAEGDIACVFSGAPFDLVRLNMPVRGGRTFTLRSGQQLRIQGTPLGLRGYLCVAGGLRTPVVLGSRTGLASITVGMNLPCLGGVTTSCFPDPATAPFPLLPEAMGSVRLRVLPGSQADWFPPRALSGMEFEVSPDSNRMGVRLLGQPLAVPARELVSEPVCPGTVQVTRDGQCVILGVDAQTIGGYPRLAQVIAADLDRVGQLRPGTAVHLERVSLDEAITLFHDRQHRLRRWLSLLRVAREWSRPPV
jgi:5-oxoprolinase (ATP-hydrolysing) subunit C